MPPVIAIAKHTCPFLWIGPYAAGDAWSLGVVAYYCLCGRLPFVAKNDVTLVSSEAQGTVARTLR